MDSQDLTENTERQDLLPATSDKDKTRQEIPSPSEEPQIPEQPVIDTSDLYRYERCTIYLALTLLPDDGHADGRMVLLGAHNDRDTPIIAAPCRLNQLALPKQALDLLSELRADLPRRQQVMQEKLCATQQKLAVKAAGKPKAAQDEQLADSPQPAAPDPVSPSMPIAKTKGVSKAVTNKTSSKRQKGESDLEQLSFF